MMIEQVHRCTIIINAELEELVVDGTRGGGLAAADYRALAEFRHALRRFLAFSERCARASGLAPQQHQAILAIKGNSAGSMGIGDLAERLMVRHHSAVELVDRLVKAALVRRVADPDDRRRVRLVLTPKAEALLERLSAGHLAELGYMRPMLTDLLQRLPPPGDQAAAALSAG